MSLERRLWFMSTPSLISAAVSSSEACDLAVIIYNIPNILAIRNFQTDKATAMKFFHVHDRFSEITTETYKYKYIYIYTGNYINQSSYIQEGVS